jgi:hypothetical protein
MKIFLVAITFCLLLKSRSCNSKKQKREKFIKEVTDEVVKTATSLFAPRAQVICDEKNDLTADKTETEKTLGIVGTLKCNESPIITIYLTDTDGKLEYDIKHANLQTRIDIGQNIPGNMEDYMRDYIEKCVRRFMERLENIALNTKEILNDLIKMQDLREKAKVSPKMRKPEILKISEDKEARIEQIKKSLVERPCMIEDKSLCPTGNTEMDNAGPVKFTVDFESGSSADVHLFYLPSANTILIDVWSDRFNFQYEFNVVTRPFIINSLENLFARIKAEVVDTMNAVLTKNLSKPIKETIKEILEVALTGKEPEISESLPAKEGEPTKVEKPATSSEDIVDFGKKFKIEFSDANNVLEVTINYYPQGFTDTKKEAVGVIKKSFLANSVYYIVPFIEEFIFSYISRFDSSLKIETKSLDWKKPGVDLPPFVLSPFSKGEGVFTLITPVTTENSPKPCEFQFIKKTTAKKRLRDLNDRIRDSHESEPLAKVTKAIKEVLGNKRARRMVVL